MTRPAQTEKVNKGRRRFLKVSLYGGGAAALSLGLYLSLGGEKTRSLTESWLPQPGDWAPNAWLSVEANGKILVRVNHSEMGQGVTTGLPTIIADEMGADWSQVVFEIAPVEAVYKNPAMNVYMTGGSTSTPTSWDILRQAGAVARQMLIEAAAKGWSVPPAQCRTEKGWVIHAPSGRRADFGSLTGAAAKLAVPKKVTLKSPQDYNLIGTNPPRLDIPDKITGRAVYGIDVRLPGLLTATVIHPPVIGDSLKSFQAGKALKMPGVKAVVPISTGLAVVAETFWQAQKAARVVEITWDGAGDQNLSTQGLFQRWAGLAQTGEAKELHKEGEPGQAAGAKTITAQYRLPFQAHLTPEPMNCTVQLEKNRAWVWAPTQNQDGVQEVTARLTGLAYDDIEVITPFLGGGFGRRGGVDYASEAVQIALAVNKPVKLIWSREEDVKADTFRPASFNTLSARLDAQGLPTAWTHRIVGPDQNSQVIPKLLPTVLPYWVPRGARSLAGWAGEKLMSGLMAGQGVITGAAPLPYAIPNVLVDYVPDDPGVAVGFWRSVGSSSNAFVVESFIDEIAAAGGLDPLDLRLKLLAKTPRLKAALELAATKAGWRTKPQPGRHRGLAVHEFHHTMVAMVAEVSVQDKEIKVHKVVCGVDCGRVINPNNVKTQISGGLIFGLTATLKSQITIKNGRVEQSNFHDFPILTLDETPDIEVHLINSDLPPTGIGEPGVPPIAPAVANAVFAATGQRLRELPLKL